MVSVDGYRNDINHACEPKGKHTDQDLDPELGVNSHHVQSRNDQGSILIQSVQNSAQNCDSFVRLRNGNSGFHFGAKNDRLFTPRVRALLRT